MDAPTIVVIDEHEDIRQLFELVLTAAGYRVVLGANIRRAANLVRQHRPCLVLLDLHTWNEARAWPLLLRLRHDPATWAVPVLVCSADGSLLRRRAADFQRLGVATLEKPFDLDGLLAQLAAMARLPAHEVGTDPAWSQL